VTEIQLRNPEAKAIIEGILLLSSPISKGKQNHEGLQPPVPNIMQSTAMSTIEMMPRPWL